MMVRCMRPPDGRSRPSIPPSANTDIRRVGAMRGRSPAEAGWTPVLRELRPRVLRSEQPGTCPTPVTGLPARRAQIRDQDPTERRKAALAIATPGGRTNFTDAIPRSGVASTSRGSPGSPCRRRPASRTGRRAPRPWRPAAWRRRPWPRASCASFRSLSIMAVANPPASPRLDGAVGAHCYAGNGGDDVFEGDEVGLVAADHKSQRARVGRLCAPGDRRVGKTEAGRFGLDGHGAGAFDIDGGTVDQDRRPVRVRQDMFGIDLAHV